MEETKSSYEKKDNLTGLFERDKLYELDLNEYGQVTIACLDLDNFKKN